jgi:hypothetical protein
MRARTVKHGATCACLFGALLQIPALSAMAFAGDAEPARVRVSTALLDEAIRGVLPATILLPAGSGEAPGEPATPAQLTEARYCGVTDRGAGKLRMIAQSSAARPGLPMLAGPHACQVSLGDLARRARTEAALADGATLLEVEASWRPWDLHLVVVRSVDLSKPTAGHALGPLDRRRELLAIPTGDNRIDTDNGPIVVFAIPVFVEAGVDLVVFAGAGGAAPSVRSGRLLADARGPRLFGAANAAVEIPGTLANLVLRLLTSNRPISIPAKGDDIELRNLSLSLAGSGDGGRLGLSGDASPRSMRESMRWTLTATGEPLRVSALRMVADQEDCDGLGTMAAVACKVRNGARTAGAEALATSLTQRYQGQMVHELAGAQDLHLSVAGQRLGLRGEIVRMGVGPRGLWVAARLFPTGR